MVFVATPTQLYILRFLIGVAEAGFYPCVIYYFSSWFPPCHRGRAVSRFYVATPLTSLLLGAISGWMLALDGTRGLHGWQWLFLLQGLPSVAVGLLLWRFLPDRPDTVTWLSHEERAWITRALADEQARIGAPSSHNPLAAMRNPRVLHLGLYGALLMGVVITFVLSAPLVLTAATGWSTGKVGWVVAAGGVTGALLMLFAAGHADRAQARFEHAIGYCMALTGAMMLLAASSDPRGVIAAYLVFATTCYVIPMLTSSGWTEVLSARELAVGAAAINTLSQVGAFVTPFAWGALKDATGNYQAGFVMLSLLAVSATLLLWLFCRRQSRAAPVPLPLGA